MKNKKNNAILWVYCMIAAILLFMLILATGCRTLEQIKTEAASIQTELETAVDELGADIVSQIGEKVRREIRRTREKLPRKIRREIERAALKIGLRIKLQKPPTKIEKQKAQVYLAEVKKTQKYKEIIKGNTPILPPLEQGADEAHFVQPVGYKWEPSAELREDFFERNPKVRTARKELQYLLMAMWELNLDFVGYEGHRSCARQREMYEKKVSQIKTCTGDHNTNPSNAVDLVPIDGKKAEWENRQQYCHLGGVARALYCNLARQHGWTAGFRWGGDFDRDGRVAERGSFIDMPHFSISEKYDLRCG